MDRIKLEDSVGRLETLLELKWKLDEVIDITSKRELEQFITADRMLLTSMQTEFDGIVSALRFKEDEEVFSDELPDEPED